MDSKQKYELVARGIVILAAIAAAYLTGDAAALVDAVRALSH